MDARAQRVAGRGEQHAAEVLVPSQDWQRAGIGRPPLSRTNRKLDPVPSLETDLHPFNRDVLPTRVGAGCRHGSSGDRCAQCQGQQQGPPGAGLAPCRVRPAPPSSNKGHFSALPCWDAREAHRRRSSRTISPGRIQTPPDLSSIVVDASRPTVLQPSSSAEWRHRVGVALMDVRVPGITRQGSAQRLRRQGRSLGHVGKEREPAPDLGRQGAAPGRGGLLVHDGQGMAPAAGVAVGASHVRRAAPAGLTGPSSRGPWARQRRSRRRGLAAGRAPLRGPRVHGPWRPHRLHRSARRTRPPGPPPPGAPRRRHADSPAADALGARPPRGRPRRR